MKDILSTITAYREERGWTEYQLAERAGLPQSTISSWYRKRLVPSLPSLEKVCAAFGITLSQFFAEGEMVELTPELQEVFENWRTLTPEQKKAMLVLLHTFNHDKE